MDNYSIATDFINYIGEHYDEIQTHIKMLCGRNKERFDEDIFHDSVIRCFNCIKKKGTMKDPSAYGMESYLIRSYFTNVKESKRACNTSKRDANITGDKVGELYEDWYNNHNNDAMTKIKSDLYKDFSTLYIMMKVEEQFDNEHFYLFRLKTLCEMTYKQLCEKTSVKGCRQKVVEVKNWLKENLSKEEINNAFYQMYGELL